MLLLFFFNDTATTEIYTLSLHDALPIFHVGSKRLKTNTVSNTAFRGFGGPQGMLVIEHVMDRIAWATGRDRKSTRLNSSHANISYAVFCLKKKTTRHYLLYASIIDCMLP